MFSWKFCKILKNTFFMEHLQWLISGTLSVTTFYVWSLQFKGTCGRHSFRISNFKNDTTEVNFSSTSLIQRQVCGTNFQSLVTIQKNNFLNDCWIGIVTCNFAKYFYYILNIFRQLTLDSSPSLFENSKMRRVYSRNFYITLYYLTQCVARFTI